MEQIALAMRPGHAWRKELDAVGLGKNSDRWLICWDENFPKIQALMKKLADKNATEMVTPQTANETPPLIRYHDLKAPKAVGYPSIAPDGKGDWMILGPYSIGGMLQG
jgi:hypothetical protein